MNLDVFFKSVRTSVFHGSLTRGQVDGMERIIAYRDENYPRLGNEQLAYVLATVAWETGYRMVPVKEAGGERYLRSKKYWPHIGVGLVQVTWKANWDRFGIKSVEDGLSWPTALHAAFSGMTRGMFTGKKLSDYIDGGKRDYMQARRIINGMDRAGEIAAIATKFLHALEAASVRIPPIPKPEVQSFTYEQFCEWLVKAINEDPNVRGALIAAVFPDEPEAVEAEPDPMDEPHDEWGGQEPDDLSLAYRGVPTYSDAEQPDERYG